MQQSHRTHRRSGAGVSVRTPTAFAIALAFASGAEAAVDPAGPQATFSSDFLHAAGPVDLTRFERGNVVLPGTYRVQVIVNQQPAPGTRDITFRHVAQSESAVPCLDRSLLLGLGVDLEKVDARAMGDDAVTTLDDAALCGPLARYIPGASLDFDDAEQVMRVSIPQIFMASRSRGYVSPALWDEGEQAVMLNYNASTFQVRRDGERATASYVNLRAGANMGGWRVRHAGTWSVAEGHRHWTNSQTFAQHDLTDARAQLTLGDTYTSGEILDSVRVRGVTLKSDPRMLPASQRGYAPVIRGVAESNAQVTVRQGGSLIYSTTVAPGAFEVTDIFPTGYGSDLEVTVTEADGRVKTILVPFTAVPQMLREGTTQFSASAGQVAETSVRETPFIFQATAQHGVTSNATLYAGTTASNSYWSGLVGAAVNLPFGAVALDVTGSRAAFRRYGVLRGVSTRVRFNRTLASTGTSVGIAAYRFSSRDYLGVVDAARRRSDLRRGGRAALVGGERSRFDATVSQRAGRGQFSVSGSLVDYWDTRSRSVNYTLGYGSSWRRISYNMSVQRARLGDVMGGGYNHHRRGVTDTTVYLSLSVPLGTAAGAPQLNASYNRATAGGHALNTTLNGAFDAEQDVTYNVAANRTAYEGRATSGASATLGYRAGAGLFRAGLGRTSTGTSQYSASAVGAVVAHRYGVTLAHELGETNAILHAPGAAGARIDGTSGARLDRHGNVVVRGLLPYQLNTLSVDPRGASTDVQLESTSHTVAPRAGAFVAIEYATSVAVAVMIHASRIGGEPLPFGASVLDAAGQAVGVVGQGGKIFTRGAAPGDRLHVRWGEGPAGQCEIQMPSRVEALPMQGLHRTARAACVSSVE